MEPHGHNRGIMRDPHGAPLTLGQSLSWEGKLLIPLLWKAYPSKISTNKYSEPMCCTSSTYTCAQTNKTAHCPHKQKYHLCPQRSISLSSSGPPQWHVTMAFDTSLWMTVITPNFGSWQTTMGSSWPQSLCFSSAWSGKQNRIIDVPAELEQVLPKEALSWWFKPSCWMFFFCCCFCGFHAVIRYWRWAVTNDFSSSEFF